MCVWGYNPVKHCRGFASLLTVDHLDGNSINNRLDNLRLLTRVNNTSNQVQLVKTALIGSFSLKG